MSVKVMSRVWDSASQGGSDKLMLLALADRADEDGICWPGMAYLAGKCGVTERQAQRTISKLAIRGEVYVETGGGKGKTNSYFITVGLPAADIKEILIRRLKKPDDEAEAIVQSIFEVPDPKGVIDVTVSAPKGDVDVTLTENSNGDADVTLSSAKGDVDVTVSEPNPDIHDAIPRHPCHPIRLYPLNTKDSFISHADLEFDGSEAQRCWADILDQLQHRMSKGQFETHFSQTDAVGGIDGHLLVMAKTDRSHEIITKRLKRVVDRAIGQPNDWAVSTVEFIKPSGVKDVE